MKKDKWNLLKDYLYELRLRHMFFVVMYVPLITEIIEKMEELEAGD